MIVDTFLSLSMAAEFFPPLSMVETLLSPSIAADLYSLLSMVGESLLSPPMTTDFLPLPLKVVHFFLPLLIVADSLPPLFSTVADPLLPLPSEGVAFLPLFLPLSQPIVFVLCHLPTYSHKLLEENHQFHLQQLSD